MFLTMQDILALTFVALAGVYLGRRVWSTWMRRRGGGCGGGGCGHCPAAKEPTTPTLVTLDGFPPNKGEKRG